MNTSDQLDSTRRRGRSKAKRTAILDAAESLFLSAGYDRVSVDAIALQAEVSKRTIYDHFGNKEGLFAAVATHATAGLLAALETAVEEELPDGCDPGPSLLAFVLRVSTETFESSEYALFRNLLTAAGPPGVLARIDVSEELIVGRLAAFHRAGVLHAPNAKRAAEHFVALTFSLALDAQAQHADADELRSVFSDGVDAFMRAYSEHARS